MSEIIYAYTEKADKNYPAFLYIDRDDNDVVTLAVRSRHVLDGSLSLIDMPEDELVKMAENILKECK